LVAGDFRRIDVDERSGKRTVVDMKPASDEIMTFVVDLRRRKFGSRWWASMRSPFVVAAALVAIVGVVAASVVVRQ
jgi:hypothetical protein